MYVRKRGNGEIYWCTGEGLCGKGVTMSKLHNQSNSKHVQETKMTYEGVQRRKTLMVGIHCERVGSVSEWLIQ